MRAGACRRACRCGCACCFAACSCCWRWRRWRWPWSCCRTRRSAATATTSRPSARPRRSRWRGCATGRPAGAAQPTPREAATPCARWCCPTPRSISTTEQGAAGSGMAGCPVRYPDGSALCAAVGNNPYAGGFIYLVGSFRAGDLVPRGAAISSWARCTVPSRRRLARRGHALDRALRASPRPQAAPHRLLGSAPIASGARPVRDFRGWLWQSAAASRRRQRRRSAPARFLPSACRWRCSARRCPKGPMAAADLDHIKCTCRCWRPAAAPLFDSNAPGASPPFSLAELRSLCSPARRCPSAAGRPRRRVVLKAPRTTSRLAADPRLIRRLPVDGSTRRCGARHHRHAARPVRARADRRRARHRPGPGGRRHPHVLVRGRDAARHRLAWLA